MNKEIVTYTSKESHGSFRHTCFMYGLYLHLIILYFLTLSFYFELQLIKQEMYDMNANYINITRKEMELQMKFLQDEVCSEINILNRAKRDIFLSNRSQLEPGSFTRKSNKNGDSERRNHRERRGKKNRKKRGHGFFPRASLFIGAVPEPVVRDGGLIAPWLLQNEVIKDFALVTKVPTKGRDSIEIVETGLYFLYAQVYYVSSANMTKLYNSFLIMNKPSSGSEKMLAKCSTVGHIELGGEVSCFTAIAQTLLTGDVVYLKQRERNRHINMTPSETYLGFILLNKKYN